MPQDSCGQQGQLSPGTVLRHALVSLLLHCVLQARWPWSLQSPVCLRLPESAKTHTCIWGRVQALRLHSEQLQGGATALANISLLSLPSSKWLLL